MKVIVYSKILNQRYKGTYSYVNNYVAMCTTAMESVNWFLVVDMLC